MELFKLFAVSAVVMGIAHTITKERLAAPLRERLGGKRTWFGYLVSCPFCVSHWLAFILVPLTGAYYVEVVVPHGMIAKLLSWFLSSILVAVIAAFLRVGFYFVDESKELVRQEKVVKTEAAKHKLANGDEATETESERSPAANRPSDEQRPRI